MKNLKHIREALMQKQKRTSVNKISKKESNYLLIIGQKESRISYLENLIVQAYKKIHIRHGLTNCCNEFNPYFHKEDCVFKQIGEEFFK